MVDTLKSQSIHNLDGDASSLPQANIFTQNNAGAGAPGLLRSVSDFVAMAAAGLGSTSSTYKLVRLQSDVILKSLNLIFSTPPDTGGGSDTLALDVGAYYSDSTTDGTSSANQGTVISATSFASAFLVTATTGAKGVKNNVLLNINPNLFNSPLWVALGLSADPGGQIDVVVAVHTVADAAAAAVMYCEASYAL